MIFLKAGILFLIVELIFGLLLPLVIKNDFMVGGFSAIAGRAAYDIYLFKKKIL
jgi:hypothetical protein